MENADKRNQALQALQAYVDKLADAIVRKWMSGELQRESFAGSSTRSFGDRENTAKLVRDAISARYGIVTRLEIEENSPYPHPWYTLVLYAVQPQRTQGPDADGTGAPHNLEATLEQLRAQQQAAQTTIQNLRKAVRAHATCEGYDLTDDDLARIERGETSVYRLAYPEEHDDNYVDKNGGAE